MVAAESSLVSTRDNKIDMFILSSLMTDDTDIACKF